MQRLLPTLLCGVFLLSTTSESVLANHDLVRRKPNFFERLFGVRPKAQKPPRISNQNFSGGIDNSDFYDARPSKKTLFGNKQRVTKVKPNRVAILKPRAATPARKVVTANKILPARKTPTVAVVDDPEDLPTLGMGNLPYIPPKEISLYNEFATVAPADSAEALAVREVFSARNSGLKAEAIDGDAIFKHYAGRRFKPMWVENGKFSDRAQKVLVQLGKAESDGLQPQNYLPFGFADFDANTVAVPSDTASQAKLDLAITIAALKFARHISGGQFEPKRLSLYYDIKPQAVDLATALKVLTYSPFPDNYLANIAPDHIQYQQLRQELSVLKAGATNSRFALLDKPIKKSQRGSQVIALRERLLADGYLAAPDALVPEADKDLLDVNLSAALKNFQTAENIKSSGTLDQATINKLNVDKSAEHIQKLVVNLERVRWLPKKLGARHVLVNQAGYELGVFENGKRIWTSRVIVGKPLNQTNVFNDRMENIVFNPQWGMPQSILVNEYRKKLSKNPGYFDKIGYKVYDTDGDIIPSNKVNWSKYGNKIPYTVVQPPGEGNALGEVKFNFPNAHAIYMHDTPQRNLFDRSSRAFSHGCVRVNNPREFARVLLGWQETKIADTIDAAETVSTNVEIPTDVYLHYFTAWPSEAGKIRYHSDIYERDKSMIQALALGQKRAAAKTVIKVVNTEVLGTIKVE